MTQSGDVRSHAAAAGDQALEAPAEGVICVFDFEGGIGAPVEAFDPAARPEADWRWAHLRLGDNRAVKLLRAVGGLPQEALELFLDHEARVQIDQAGDWVFGVLPDYERDLGGRAQDEGRVAFAFDERSLVTGRLHALLAVDDLRHAAASGEALQSPAAAVTRLVELYAERTEEQLAEIAAALEKVEDYVLAEPAAPGEINLSGRRRKLARHRRELQSLRTALTRAGVRRATRPAERLGADIAGVLAFIEDIDHEAAALQERGRLLHEEIDTLINAATNRSMRTLTVISTLLIPPTLIVGAFGMNVPGIPWEHSTTGFWAASALCVAVVGGAVWMLRRMGLFS